MGQSADGIPLLHTVHASNVAETRTLQGMVPRGLARFAVERVILVADRGLLSLDNVAELVTLAKTQAHQLEFIVAVPARRYGEAQDGGHSARGRRATDRGAYSRFQRALSETELTRLDQAERFGYSINEAAIERAGHHRLPQTSREYFVELFMTQVSGAGQLQPLHYFRLQRYRSDKYHDVKNVPNICYPHS